MALPRQHLRAAIFSGALALATGSVTAMVAQAAEPLAPMRVVQVGEIEYISGGKNEAEREELQARATDFRLQVNFSAAGSAPRPKRVDVKLIRRGDAKRAINLTSAGPMLLVNMPSGTYKLSASVAGAPPVESQVELLPGENEQLEVDLESSTARSVD
jgi:hypothetical protein